jgi:hypothetical protein
MESRLQIQFDVLPGSTEESHAELKFISIQFFILPLGQITDIGNVIHL